MDRRGEHDGRGRMERVEVDREAPQPDRVERAAAVIRRGGLVAFPTETVYGLGANALDPAAVARIFEAKGRPRYNPLIVHVDGVAAARRLALSWPPLADVLAEAFWPGPLTMVLPRRPEVPEIVSAGLPTVALRVPAHPVALALLRAAALPIVAPSANPSTALSPTRAEHVVRALGDRIDLVLDAGPTGVGIESTVLDLSGERPVLLRPGALSAADLEPLTGALERPVEGDEAAPRPSPGMLERHYAPRASLSLFGPEGRTAAVARARSAAGEGAVVGALVFEPLGVAGDREVLMPRDPAGYARKLYAALHGLDDRGCDLVLVERVPDGTAWEGVRDRLQRAAQP